MADPDETTLLADALFQLAKASAEYAALPEVSARTGMVNPQLTSELLQIMQDSARAIAQLLVGA